MDSAGFEWGKKLDLLKMAVKFRVPHYGGNTFYQLRDYHLLR
jgi:hypothetical protein